MIFVTFVRQGGAGDDISANIEVEDEKGGGDGFRDGVEVLNYSLTTYWAAEKEREVCMEQ